MNITSLVTTKFGRIVLGVAATGALTAASLGLSGVAQARSVRCDAAGHCKTYCTQTLPNGNYVEYEEGTNIIVTYTDGTQGHYTCKNGQWVKTSRVVVTNSTLAPNAGARLSIASR
jgi:hypothetical protein